MNKSMQRNDNFSMTGDGSWLETIEHVSDFLPQVRGDLFCFLFCNGFRYLRRDVEGELD